MKRIIIIGTSGSGKTSLGKFLAAQLQLPLTDLDDLFWLPGWQPRPKKEFSTLIEQAANKNQWIICGNQSKSHPLFWPKADTIIWLDLPFSCLFWRVFKRGIKQMRNRELICNGNRQTLSQFIWILYWVIKSYRRKRRTYSKLMQTICHVQWIRLKTRKELSSFCEEIANTRQVR